VSCVSRILLLEVTPFTRQVFVNAGEHFDAESGRFVGKYSGIYHFTYTVQSYLDKFLGVQLMKNNEPQVT